MKKIILIFCCITGTIVAFGQALPKEKIELYSSLTIQLDSIYNEDQKYRQMLGDIEAKHGLESKEMKDLWKTIGKKEESVLAASWRLTYPFNLTGLPAISVPCGFDSEGLPIGLQIAGRPFDEATILHCAALIERTVGLNLRPELG